MHSDMASENRALLRTVWRQEHEIRELEKRLDGFVRDSIHDMRAMECAENVVPLRTMRVGGGAR